MLLQDVEPPRSRTPSRRVLPSAQLFQLCSVWAPSFIDPMLCHISLMPAHVILHLSHVNHISIRDLLCYIVLSHVYLRVSSVLHVISCYFKWLGIILSHVNSCHPIYLVFFMWLHCFTSQVRDDFGTFHLRRQAAFSLQNWNEGWNDENIFLCRMPSWTGLHC